MMMMMMMIVNIFYNQSSCFRAMHSITISTSFHATHPVFSVGFKLELKATDQEGLHFYVGSNFHRPTPETRGRLRGGSNVRNAIKCVLINAIPILMTAVQNNFCLLTR